MNAVNTYEVPVTHQINDENSPPSTPSCKPVEPIYTIGCKDHRIMVSGGDKLIGEAQDTDKLRSLVQSLGVTHLNQVRFDDSIESAKKCGFDSGFEVYYTVMQALAEKTDIPHSSFQSESSILGTSTRFTELGWKVFIEEQKDFFNERIDHFIDIYGPSRGFSSFDGEVDMLHFKYNLPSYTDEYSNELSSGVTRVLDVMGEKLDQSHWTFFTDSVDSESKKRRNDGNRKSSHFQYTVAIVFFHTLATLLQPVDIRISLSSRALVQELIFSLWTCSGDVCSFYDEIGEILKECGLEIGSNDSSLLSMRGSRH